MTESLSVDFSSCWTMVYFASHQVRSSREHCCVLNQPFLLFFLTNPLTVFPPSFKFLCKHCKKQKTPIPYMELSILMFLSKGERKFILPAFAMEIPTHCCWLQLSSLQFRTRNRGKWKKDDYILSENDSISCFLGLSKCVLAWQETPIWQTFSSSFGYLYIHILPRKEVLCWVIFTVHFRRETGGEVYLHE